MSLSESLHKALGIPTARVFKGGGGSFVSVGVVEYGADLSHPDLREYPIKAFGTNSTDPVLVKHGTMSLGLLFSDENDEGTEGLCPRSSAFAFLHYGSPANTAIARAITILGAGDVLLLEDQLPSSGGYVPCETFQPTYDEIVKAVAKGIIVVEAAGNGSRDIDGLLLGDSGAIMVGSTHPTSNTGQRIDVVGPGQGVPSTIPGGWDDDDFTGTSGASAAVAGVVALLSSVGKAYHWHVNDGDWVRLVLRASGLDLDGILRVLFACADWNLDGTVNAMDYFSAMPSLRKMRDVVYQYGKQWPISYR